MKATKYNVMRLLLFFDLPVETKEEISEYTHFRKGLLRCGYHMVQYSVYMKVLTFKSKISDEVNKIKKILPNDGNVRIIAVTEKQYQEMYLVLGNKKVDEIYNNTERYIKI